MELHGMDQAGTTVGFCAAQGDDFYAETHATEAELMVKTGQHR
ncbi:hypothetical protein [Mesorhizobium sp. M1365]